MRCRCQQIPEAPWSGKILATIAEVQSPIHCVSSTKLAGSGIVKRG